ncbi:MAG TPA: hypothetical protein VHZ76_01120, partial [Gammaproteobacteria bacterium]|nr:hypothetical protein [Gammaproteobacteria bacterium]
MVDITEIPERHPTDPYILNSHPLLFWHRAQIEPTQQKLYWLKLAAYCGHTQAFEEFFILAQKNNLPQHQMKEALNHILKNLEARVRNYPDITIFLASLYENGNQVNRDIITAIKYYVKALPHIKASTKLIELIETNNAVVLTILANGHEIVRFFNKIAANYHPFPDYDSPHHEHPEHLILLTTAIQNSALPLMQRSKDNTGNLKTLWLAALNCELCLTKAIQKYESQQQAAPASEPQTVETQLSLFQTIANANQSILNLDSVQLLESITMHDNPNEEYNRAQEILNFLPRIYNYNANEFHDSVYQRSRNNANIFPAKLNDRVSFSIPCSPLLAFFIAIRLKNANVDSLNSLNLSKMSVPSFLCRAIISGLPATLEPWATTLLSELLEQSPVETICAIGEWYQELQVANKRPTDIDEKIASKFKELTTRLKNCRPEERNAYLLNLAMFYRFGLHTVPRVPNIEKALFYYAQAIKENNGEAARQLRAWAEHHWKTLEINLQQGNPTEAMPELFWQQAQASRSYDKILDWYQRAACYGHIDSINAFGEVVKLIKEEEKSYIARRTNIIATLTNKARLGDKKTIYALAYISKNQLLGQKHDINFVFKQLILALPLKAAVDELKKEIKNYSHRDILSFDSSNWEMIKNLFNEKFQLLEADRINAILRDRNLNFLSMHLIPALENIFDKSLVISDLLKSLKCYHEKFHATELEILTKQENRNQLTAEQKKEIILIYSKSDIWRSSIVDDFFNVEKRPASVVKLADRRDQGLPLDHDTLYNELDNKLNFNSGRKPETILLYFALLYPQYDKLLDLLLAITLNDPDSYNAHEEAYARKIQGVCAMFSSKQWTTAALEKINAIKKCLGNKTSLFSLPDTRCHTERWIAAAAYALVDLENNEKHAPRIIDIYKQILGEDAVAAHLQNRISAKPVLALTATCAEEKPIATIAVSTHSNR